MQVLTVSGGNFSNCVPPDTLRADSSPEALLQRRALLQQFAAYVKEHNAFLAMHTRHVTSNMADLDPEVCCSSGKLKYIRTCCSGSSIFDILLGTVARRVPGKAGRIQ